MSAHGGREIYPSAAPTGLRVDYVADVIDTAGD